MELTIVVRVVLVGVDVLKPTAVSAQGAESAVYRVFPTLCSAGNSLGGFRHSMIHHTTNRTLRAKDKELEQQYR